MIREILILLLLSLLTFSCRKERKNTIKIIHLNPVKLSLKPDVFKDKDPREIFKAGENEMIIRNSKSNLFYDLIDVNKGDIHSFGVKGRGPGEILSCHSPFYCKKIELCFLMI
jgi:hypothetical protein